MYECDKLREEVIDQQRLIALPPENFPLQLPAVFRWLFNTNINPYEFFARHWNWNIPCWEVVHYSGPSLPIELWLPIFDQVWNH